MSATDIPVRTISGTGHRPDKLGGYGDDVFLPLVRLADEHLVCAMPDVVISGMALGWDQALAMAAITRGIPCDAYLPCHGQESRWPAESRDRYRWILERCRSIRYIHDGPYIGPEVMLQRNIAMVNDTTDHVVALWNGSRGGTSHCVAYARKNGVEMVNMWDRWRSFVR